MNTVWVVLGLALAGGVVALVTSWLRGDDSPDMGAVSHQWLMEHRLGPGYDSRR